MELPAADTGAAVTPGMCGLLVGLLAGAGTLLALSALRRRSVPELHRRVLPYLGWGTSRDVVRAGARGGGTAWRDPVGVLRERRRERRLRAELPALLELLWLAVLAGEGVPEALGRVARAGGGPVARTLRRCLSDAPADRPVTVALRETGRLLDSPGVARLLDDVATALAGGAATEDTLYALLRDAREGGGGAVRDGAPWGAA